MGEIFFIKNKPQNEKERLVTDLFSLLYMKTSIQGKSK